MQQKQYTFENFTNVFLSISVKGLVVKATSSISVFSIIE